MCDLHNILQQLYSNKFVIYIHIQPVTSTSQVLGYLGIGTNTSHWYHYGYLTLVSVPVRPNRNNELLFTLAGSVISFDRMNVTLSLLARPRPCSMQSSFAHADAAVQGTETETGWFNNPTKGRNAAGSSVF